MLMLVLLIGGVGCSSGGDSPESVGRSAAALCSSATLTTNFPTYTAAPGQTVVWTASGSCASSVQYAFNLRNTSGVFIRVQDWSPSNQWTWNTNAYPTGSYYVEVLVSDAPGTPANYDTFGSAYFALTSSSPCTAVSTVVSPAGAASVGSQVTFTSSTTGCTGAEFRIVHRYPNGTFVEASPYSTANSVWTWNTTQGNGVANAPGTHYFEVWVRAQGSPASYEAYTSKYYSLQSSPACTSATLTVSPAGHATSGTQVTLSMTATGCAIPSYRYIVRLTNGTFVQLQDWTASATATWNTALLPGGSYYLEVWARASDSTASYETFTSTYYTLDAATVTATPQAFAGGFDSYCLLKSTGKVDCWGYNVHNELGDGTAVSASFIPVTNGITTGVALAAGYFHQCALITGSKVQCWGSNAHGQIGDGTTNTAATPATVPGITSAVSIGAGNAHTCAVLSDGSVKCWGYNSQGQLGNAMGVDSHTPVSVVGISTAKQVVGGYYHSCAVLADGTVRCWGLGTSGQLGNGANTNSLTPVTVSGLSGVTAISSASGSTCALKSDHTIWCWGGNGQGNLGDGTTTTRTTPVQVSGIATATSVAVNQDHGCATLQDHTAVCWGYNGYGQLGNATTTSSLVPVTVSGITTAATVAVGDHNSCVTLTDGTAACWGYDGAGGLGNGSTTTGDQSSPVAVSTLP
ncbi:MAG: hypothetical protein WDO74_21000 [Pseudomonadota bacterium]